MKREVKQTYTYSGLPSVRRAAMKRAKAAGESISEVIDECLKDYAKSPIWKEVESGRPIKLSDLKKRDIELK